MLLSEISHSTTFFWLPCMVCKTNKLASRTFIHDHHVFETQAIFFLMKDKQSIIGQLEKGEKGVNLSAEYGISKQQISDIRRNKETSVKFADIWHSNVWSPKQFVKVLFDD